MRQAFHPYSRALPSRSNQASGSVWSDEQAASSRPSLSHCSASLRLDLAGSGPTARTLPALGFRRCEAVSPSSHKIPVLFSGTLRTNLDLFDQHDDDVLLQAFPHVYPLETPEAISAVDMGTDALIQESIREQFHGITLIVIAHRLSTIAKFDKILIMDNGNVVGFDGPRRLLEKPDEKFPNTLNESGEKEKIERLAYEASIT